MQSIEVVGRWCEKLGTQKEERWRGGCLLRVITDDAAAGVLACSPSEEGAPDSTSESDLLLL